MLCDLEKRGKWYQCRKCGWWIAAAQVTPPIRRQCRGDAEPKTGLRGAGDLAEVVATETGLSLLTRMVEKIRRGGCGCELRKGRWNKLIPFARPKRKKSDGEEVRPSGNGA